MTSEREMVMSVLNIFDKDNVMATLVLYIGDIRGVNGYVCVAYL